MDKKLRSVPIIFLISTLSEAFRVLLFQVEVEETCEGPHGLNDFNQNVMPIISAQILLQRMNPTRPQCSGRI